LRGADDIKGEKYKVLVTVSTFGDDECARARELLESSGCSILMHRSVRPDDAVFYEKVGLADAAIIGGEPWDAKLLSHAKNMKIITRFGVGYDAVDLKITREMNIDVANTRTRELSDGVAELALGFMLCMLRGIPQYDGLLKSKGWEYRKGTQLSGKTIGLVGFGHIAQSLAKMLSGFDVRIIACDKYPNHKIAEGLNVAFAGFEDLLRESDIISLHVPSADDTFHLINEKTLNLMKKSAILINSSRGALVDEKALYACLSAGRIAGAATDVFEREPTERDNPLFALDNFVCTPHVAAMCVETISSIAYASAQSVVDHMHGKPLSNIVNL
jgi:D-3-phosphoglycerate dehydrogenase